jgi:hypothetical protein
MNTKCRVTKVGTVSFEQGQFIFRNWAIEVNDDIGFTSQELINIYLLSKTNDL